ncbi:MAG: glycosyltransferase [Gemmatimonadota bacterium]|nr:glycosyltransferase [Gemmatimonadota bacterium]
MTPTVSVLLPVRDGAKHLNEAAASLDAQTFQDFEVLAVDDGSTDATPELLATWAAREARVRVVHQEALGIVPALERARGMARGPYLARMDADDVCRPKRLAEQLALMEADPAVYACGCGIEYFPAEQVRDGALRYERWLNASVTSDEIAKQLFVECPLAHPTFFMRAEAVEAIGGYRDQGWPEDYDLLLRLWAAGGRLAQVPTKLLRWRESPERLSRTHPRYAADAFLACKVHYLKRTLLEGRLGAVVWGAGPVGKAAARALVDAGVRVLAFVDVDPRKIGQDVYGATVLEAQEGAALSGALHLAAVGQPGARDQIRDRLRDAGLTELEDFVAIA